jgi:hypothetical protein
VKTTVERRLPNGRAARRRHDDLAERRALARVAEKIDASVAAAPPLPDDVAELWVALIRTSPALPAGGGRAA